MVFSKVTNLQRIIEYVKFTQYSYNQSFAFLRRFPIHTGPTRAFHKLLGNVLATSRISSNFLHSEQFLQLSSNSEISELFLSA